LDNIRYLNLDLSQLLNSNKKSIENKKMTHTDNILLTHTLGNIFIKHNDKWRGDYYLNESLNFTPNKSQAARFYILKPGDTTILNGDHISIHMQNRTIIVDNSDTLRLLDREYVDRHTSSFIITNATDSTDPITYESPIFFITDKNRKMAFKYDWGMNLINTIDNTITSESNEVTTNPSEVGHDAITAFESLTSAANYKPRDNPNLINISYGNTCETDINAFRFSLERCDNLISTDISTDITSNRNITISKNVTTATATAVATAPITLSTKSNSDLSHGYKGAIMILLLMIILVLCIILRT